MSAGFTPGPWKIGDGGVVVDHKIEGNVICLEPEHMMRASLASWDANANLIASAPDMVAALDHYADQLCEGWCEQSPDCAHFDDCGGCLARRVAWQARGGAR